MWVFGEVGMAERGCSSMVEQKPSKLMTRVRFPSPAPAASSTARYGREGDPGGESRFLEYRRCSSVVEHSLGKGEVARSIRANGTTDFFDGFFVDLTG